MEERVCQNSTGTNNSKKEKGKKNRTKMGEKDCKATGRGRGNSSAILAELYEDNEEGGGQIDDNQKYKKALQYAANYDPYKAEKTLALADRINSSSNSKTSGRERKLTFSSESFQAFEDFYALHQPLKVDVPISLPESKPATRVSISEAELASVCADVEKSVDRTLNATHTSTASSSLNRSASIVDSILRDFCESPEVSESEVLSSQSSPMLSFPRSETVHTYSRRSETLLREQMPHKIEILENLVLVEAPPPLVVESSASKASPPLPAVVNSSQKPTSAKRDSESPLPEVLDNLLNLSVHFVEVIEALPAVNSEKKQSPDMTTSGPTEMEDKHSSAIVDSKETEEEKKNLVNEKVAKKEKQSPIVMSSKAIKREDTCPLPMTKTTRKTKSEKNQSGMISRGVPKTLEEILTLREKYPNTFSGCSARELGRQFHGFNLDGGLEDTAASFDMQQDDVISTTSKLSDNVSNPFSFDEVCDITLSDNRNQILDDTVSLAKFDEADWSDESEFFANFSTQNAVEIAKFDAITGNTNKAVLKVIEAGETSKDGVEGSQLAGTERKAISETKAHRSTAEQEENSEMEVENAVENKKEALPVAAISANSLDDVPNTTASAKETLSKACKEPEMFDALDEADFELCEFLRQYKTQDAVSQPTQVPKNDPPCQAVSLGGFQTASKKSIKIDKDAQKRAAQLLSDLETQVSKNDPPCQAVSLEGFQTASKKSIQIDKDAQKRAAKLLSDLETNHSSQETKEWEAILKIDTPQTTADDGKGVVTSLVPNAVEEVKFDGFKTASRKTIDISKDTEQKVASIFAHLPQTPKVKEEFMGCDDDKTTVGEAIEKECEGVGETGQKPEEKFAAPLVAPEKIKEEFIGLPDKEEEALLPALPPKAEDGLAKIPKSEPVKEETPMESSLVEQVSSKRRRPADKARAAKVPRLSHPEPEAAALPRTPFNRIENELHEKSKLNEMAVRSPLNQSAASTIIARKNLLSLSTKRKGRKTAADSTLGRCSTSSPTIDDMDITPTLLATPLPKAVAVLGTLSTPATPNLLAFCSSVPDSSTPKNSGSIKTLDAKENLEQDFRQINLTPTEENSTEDSTQDSTQNSTLKPKRNKNAKTHDSTHPPPREHHKRLAKEEAKSKSAAMNCRPSGLRRSRNIHK